MADDFIRKHLPRWLRGVELQPDGPRLAAVESSANSLGKTLSGRDVLDMALLAHGRSYGRAFDRLSDLVQDQDPTFGCKADDLETGIAACAAVAAVMAHASKSASIAAQGVLSARWLGLSPAVADLPDLASTASRRRSEAVRRRRPLPQATTKEDFLENAPESDPNDTATHHDIQVLRTATQELAKDLRSRQRSYARVLAARLDAADEELDVLWWVVSGYSELARDHWSNLAPPAAALLCGLELASKLVFEVELPSTDALLARLLGPGDGDAVSLAEAVEGAGELLESNLSALDLPDGHPLLPILSSMSEYRTLQGSSSWRNSVARWDIDPGHSVAKLDLARQAVLERTLMGNVVNG